MNVKYRYNSLVKKYNILVGTDFNAIAGEIAWLGKQIGKTQTEVADDIGVSQQQISKVMIEYKSKAFFL